MQGDPALSAIEAWVLKHAEAGQSKIYFRINGDIPVKSGSVDLFFEIPEHGRRILVLHPRHLTPVALFCYEHGISMIQVL